MPDTNATRSLNYMSYNGAGDMIAYLTFNAPGDNAYPESYGYNAHGLRTATTNAYGFAETASYNAAQQLCEAGGTVYPVRYAYDSAGRRTGLATTRDGVSWDTTAWSFDVATGLATNKIYADNSLIGYTYTADGLPARTTYARGTWREQHYNEQRLVSQTHYSGDTPSDYHTYDQFGRVVATSNTVSSICYANDLSGNTTNEITTTGGNVLTAERSFDSFNRLTTSHSQSYFYAHDGSAPSKARRFLQGESPCRVRTSHSLVPSVGTMEEELRPNEIV